MPGLTQTAIASDSQRRDGYPTLTIKTFPENMGGPAGNTAMAVIETDSATGPWIFRSGNVSSKDLIFTANGFLDGELMIGQPDGNLKSQPYGNEGVKAFASETVCR